MPVVTANVPKMDKCPILTRLKAFVADQGVTVTLEHVFRDRRGNPVDLSEWLAAPVSESTSASGSSSASPAGVVKLRAREWLGEGPPDGRFPLMDAYGDGHDPEKGVVRVELTGDMVSKVGIYELNWAVVNDAGRPTVLDRGIMSVERSLFPVDARELFKQHGPATLQEIRMMMMDSSSAENLLLDDMEFSDDQILLALAKPIRLWNETPPPIRKYTTYDFPFRGAWTSAALGELHLMAANHYRRNRLQHSAGGVSVDDKNKEREYMAEGQRLTQEYSAWLATKKVELNLRLFCGQSISTYSSSTGW